MTTTPFSTNAELLAEYAASKAEESVRVGGQLPVQLPVADLSAGKRTGKLWRKVVLPVGRVYHPGGDLIFGADTLRRIAENFRNRAFDNVPLVVATASNRHNEDPTRYAGRVRDMAVTDRGLEIVAELNALGRRVLEGAPWIGASVRFLQDFTRPADRRRFGPVIRHVCLTGDPHVPAMGEGALLGRAPGFASGAIDLTTARYEQGGPTNMTMTPEAAVHAAARFRNATPQQRNQMIAARRQQVGEAQLRAELGQVAAASEAEYSSVLRRSGASHPSARYRSGHDTGGLY